MEFTKTDFIHYLNCSKSLWLLKREPDNYPKGGFSIFMQKLIREGYEVERYVQQFFKNATERSVSFQRVFKTDNGLFARVDAFEQTGNGETLLYEIKSSTSVKNDRKHNHIKDACFQTICAERSGQPIDRVCLVHLNGEYVRNDDIDPEKLLVFEDITDSVRDVEAETGTEIDAALTFLSSDISRKECSCRELSRANHCDTFALFNPNIPASSIYSLPRLNARKRQELLSMGVTALDAVPDDVALSVNQRRMVDSAKSGAPQINVSEIRQFLSDLEFPLYFLDYETFSSAVPLIDGASPHQHFPVQYSLHILHETGELLHREYLEREARLPLSLINSLQNDIGREGSLVSWHASFEQTRNREMAVMYPEASEFLHDLNDRMVDLEIVFKGDYVDERFQGSSSIKKVLPVVCPHLDYGDLDVQDGTSAMEAWERMLSSDFEAAEEIAKSLLNYCDRDTYAMVEIYRFLLSM